jgi:predicted GIY-YIG superfamily endonuclease
VVYLLHFDRPIPNHTAGYDRWVRHYLGTAEDLEVRLDQHRKGNGARLPQVFAERGIGFILARTWEGDRELERKLKRQKHSNRLCPICKGNEGEAI